MVEFAFLIPIILVLVGATISFGLFFFQANVLQQAVDVAAQEAEQRRAAGRRQMSTFQTRLKQ